MHWRAGWLSISNQTVIGIHCETVVRQCSWPVSVAGVNVFVHLARTRRTPTWAVDVAQESRI